MELPPSYMYSCRAVALRQSTLHGDFYNFISVRIVECFPDSTNHTLFNFQRSNEVPRACIELSSNDPGPKGSKRRHETCDTGLRGIGQECRGEWSSLRAPESTGRCAQGQGFFDGCRIFFAFPRDNSDPQPGPPEPRYSAMNLSQVLLARNDACLPGSYSRRRQTRWSDLSLSCR